VAEELVKNLLNAVNITVEDRDCLLNAPTSAELPAKLKRYRGDCFLAALEDRKAAAPLVEAATAHMAILAAPTTTIFDDPQEEQALYSEWCTSLSDSAMVRGRAAPPRLSAPRFFFW
jgi:hypothetical protein